jgi:hypothetical protein
MVGASYASCSAWGAILQGENMQVFQEHAMIFDALSRVMAKVTDPAEEARLTKIARDVDRRMKEAKRAGGGLND